MKQTRAFRRLAPRRVLPALAVVALFIAAWPAAASDLRVQTRQPPNPAAKEATVVQGGGFPLAAPPVGATMTEGFESGTVPPPGWTRVQTNPSQTWQVTPNLPHSGTYAAHVLYDTNLQDQDEWLLSPAFNAWTGQVSFWSYGSLFWCRDIHDNCDLEVWLVEGAVGGSDDVYLGLADTYWTASYTWSFSSFNYVSDGTLSRVGLRYVGNDGAEVAVDDISIQSSGSVCNDPHEPNDTRPQAAPIAYGTTIIDPDICPAGDVDYYSFTGSAGDHVIAEIDAQDLWSALDSDLYLLNSAGAQLAHNDNLWGSTDSWLEYDLTASDTYYLKVQEHSHPSEGGADHYYHLTLTAAEWTFLVYLDGDNNLESAAVNDFLEMSSVGSTDRVNIVVQFDRAAGYDNTYGNWTSTKRFFVTEELTPEADNAVEDIGEANMGDPATLEDFVWWGRENYPAHRYAVVLWDHGSGWKLAGEEGPPPKDVCVDNSHPGDRLTMPDLHEALMWSVDENWPLGILGFDACLMAMIEVDNQLLPYADVRVGSQYTEPNDGWPYDTLLTALTADPTMSPAELGTEIVDDYYASYRNNHTLSAVGLHVLYTQLNSAVDNFALALLGGLADHHGEMIIARSHTQQIYYSTYVDLYDFAEGINQHVSDATINAAATNVMDAITAALMHEHHGTSLPGAHGITVYFPSSGTQYNALYDGSSGWLEFTANSHWDEFLRAFYNCSDPHEPNNTTGQATDIPYDTRIVGADICPIGDTDFYAFHGNKGESIVADIDAKVLGSQLDSVLTLYDTDGSTQLAENDDFGGSKDSHLEYTLPADGTYYLRVREHYSGVYGGPNYFYTLLLTSPSDDVGPLAYDSHAVDDDGTGQSNGNGDGVVNCGETIELNVTVANLGTDTATGVNGSLSEQDQYVTLTSASSAYADIPGEETRTNTSPFVFNVDPATPNGHSIHFGLDLTASNGGPWPGGLDLGVVCSGEPQWTFMVYLDGDNNMEGAAIDDFLEMSSVGSDSYVNVLVQLDRGPGHDARYGDWEQTMRFYVTEGLLPEKGIDVGEVNMGKADSLTEFVDWGVKEYPAQRYALVIWDRTAVEGLCSEKMPLLGGVAHDDTDGGDTLEMTELRDALETLSEGGKYPLDLVGFDASLMALTELDNQVSPYAQVRVASQAVEPAQGWPYQAFLGTLKANPGLEAQDLGKAMVDLYYQYYGKDQTLSAVGVDIPYETLNSAVDGLALALINGLNRYQVDMGKARQETQAFEHPSYVDLYDFAEKIRDWVDDPTIDDAADSVMEAVKDTVVQELHGTGWPDAHGISIYFPESEDAYDGQYDGDKGLLEFTANSRWDEWLRAYYTGPIGDAYEPDNSSGEANPIGSGAPQTHSIVPLGDEDWVSFEVDGVSAVVVATSGPALSNTRMWLYDAYGRQLEYNDNIGGSNYYSRIERSCGLDRLAPGVYYVQVDAFGDKYEIPSYDLSLTARTCERVFLPLAMKRH
jgi:hypothetical protein